MKILKIKWIDSARMVLGWQPDVEFYSGEMETIGYLIEENTDWIIIGSNFDTEEEHFGNLTHIYKKCIIKREEF